MSFFSHLAALASRELRETARSKPPFVLRTAYAALIGTLVVAPIALAGTDKISGAAISRSSGALFAMIVSLQSLGAMVLGILMGVQSITLEKRSETLGLLALSRFRYIEILLGKVLALTGLMSMVFAGGLPLLALVGLGGGVDYSYLPWFALSSVLIGAIGIAVGLLFGLMYRSAIVASFWALASGALLSLAPELLAFVDKAPDYPLRTPLREAWFTQLPIAAASQGLAGATWTPLGTGLASFLAILFVAWLYFPRVLNAPSRRGLRGRFEALDPFFKRINPGGIEIPFSSRRIGSNPIAWLTLQSGGLARRHYALRIGTFNIIATLLVASALAAGADWAAALIPLLVIVGLLIPLMVGASAIAGERNRKTLGVMLTTPLSARDIIKGKIQAGRQMILLCFLPPFFMLAIIGWLMGGPGPGTEVWVMFFLTIAELVAGFSLCLGLSLLLSTPLRAGVAGMMLLAAANFVPFLAVTGIMVENIFSFITIVVLGGCLIGGLVVLADAEKQRPATAFLGGVAAAISSGSILAIFYGGDLLGTSWRAATLSPQERISIVLVLELALLSIGSLRFAYNHFDRVTGRTP